MWEFIALKSFIIFIESKKVWMKLSSWTLDCSIRFCWSQSVLWIIPLLKEIAQWSAENLFCCIAKILNRSFCWFKMAPNSAFKPRMTHNFYETKKISADHCGLRQNTIPLLIAEGVYDSHEWKTPGTHGQIFPLFKFKP